MAGDCAWGANDVTRTALWWQSETLVGNTAGPLTKPCFPCSEMDMVATDNFLLYREDVPLYQMR